MKPFSGKFQTSLLLATMLTAVGTTAYGQASDEIIVTATKKAQTLQEVPVAVSAVKGDAIESSGYFEVINLSQISPSVSINPSGNLTQTIVRIRGIGSGGVNPGFESAAGVVIDGVIRSRAGQALGDFLDVEQVEILRGPQGTLFGKNTTAGVIHIISKAPEFEFGGNVSASYGSYDHKRLRGAVTGPLSDKVAFRLAGSYNKRDGIIDRLAQSPTPIVEDENYYNTRDRLALKGQLLFEPSDDLSIRAVVDYSKLDEIGNTSLIEQAGPATRGFNALTGNYTPPDFQIEDRQTRYTPGQDPTEVVDDYGIGIEANWNIGAGVLTSISAYRQFDADIRFDLDSIPADYIGFLEESSDIELFSQELRYAGSTGKLDYLIGGFAARENLNTTSDINLGADLGGFFGIEPAFIPVGSLAETGIDGVGIQKQTSFSAFTHNTYNVSDDFSITAGLRLSNSKKTGGSTFNGAAPGTFINQQPTCTFLAAAFTALCNNFSTDLERSETELSGNISASYKFSDNVNSYASYSRGYKGGGFNLDREAVSNSTGPLIDNSEFDAEFVDSYELGLKTRFWDNRATVNLAAFYMDYKDYQFQQFDSVSFTVVNVPQLISKGIELDSLFSLTEGVSLTFAATYNSAKFAEDLGGPPGNFLEFYEGQTLPSAPEFQASWAFDANRPLFDNGVRGTLNVNYSYRGATNTASALTELTEEGAHGILGASVGVRSADDKYGLTLSGANLTDEFFGVFKTGGIGQAGTVIAFTNTPRTFAVTLDGKF